MASLGLDSLPMSGLKREMEKIFDYEDRRFFESDYAPYENLFKTKKKKKVPYNEKEINPQPPQPPQYPSPS